MRRFSNLLVFCVLAVIPLITAAATSRPAQHGATDWETNGHLHPDDYTFLQNLPQSRNARDLPAGFKYIFVDARGASSTIRGPVGTQIEIAGSPKTSEQGMKAAAIVVAKMTKFMPSSVFKQLATDGSAGIFTASEKLIVYPEYEYLANKGCGTSCSGSCSYSCLFDGRKYEDLAGVAGVRAAILEDNLLCTDKDPYRKSQNILAHEFAHTIHRQGLAEVTKSQIKRAYQNAKSKSTWDPTSYAISSDVEYFAEATTAFLYVSENNYASGGMVFCGSKLCPSLKATREHLRKKDPDLYNILNYVFTDNRPHLDAGLTVCPPASEVGQTVEEVQCLSNIYLTKKSVFARYISMLTQ